MVFWVLTAAALNAVSADLGTIYQTRQTLPGIEIAYRSPYVVLLHCDDNYGWCQGKPNSSFHPVNGCFTERITFGSGYDAFDRWLPNAYCPIGEILSNWSSYEVTGQSGTNSVDRTYSYYTVGNCVMTTVCGV